MSALALAQASRATASSSVRSSDSQVKPSPMAHQSTPSCLADLLLAGLPGARLEELDDADRPVVGHRPHDDAHRRGRLALALAGVDQHERRGPAQVVGPPVVGRYLGRVALGVGVAHRPDPNPRCADRTRRPEGDGCTVAGPQCHGNPVRIRGGPRHCDRGVPSPRAPPGRRCPGKAGSGARIREPGDRLRHVTRRNADPRRMGPMLTPPTAPSHHPRARPAGAPA